MAIVTMTHQSKKQGLVSIHQMPTVNKQIADFPFSRSADKLSIDDFRDLLQGIKLMLHG